jgi:hypothetical protein
MVPFHNFRNLEVVTGNIPEVLRLYVCFLISYSLCSTGATKCSGGLKWLVIAEVYLKLTGGSMWTWLFPSLFNHQDKSEVSVFSAPYTKYRRWKLFRIVKCNVGKLPLPPHTS